MAQHSSIEWTDTTWNPVIGCRKVSAGCKNCYAERMARRLAAMATADHARNRNPGRKASYLNVINKFGRWNGSVFLDHGALEEPLRWRSPRVIFVNSMSDLFHSDVTNEFILSAFEVMRRCPQHTFQVLTKRPERVIKLNDQIDWPANVWMGTSVEDSLVTHRARALLQTKAKVKFLSIEPLIGPIAQLALRGMDWVIVGGESGPGARPMHIDWVRKIRDRCGQYGIKFFFKQWGGTNKALTGRILDGRTWDDMPTLAHKEQNGGRQRTDLSRRCGSAHAGKTQNLGRVLEGLAAYSGEGTAKSIAIL